MSNELKSCPFCGSDDLITSLGPAAQDGHETVMCNQCESESAYRTWNKRSQSAPAGWQLVQAVDAAMIEMANISPPMRRSECERLIRAALAAAPKAEQPPVQCPAYSERIVPASTALIQWAWEDEPESTLFDEGYNAARRWVKMQLEYAVSKAPHPSDDVAKDALVSALEKISAIEDRYNCGDWDEIEEARNIAKEALAAYRAANPA